MFEHLNIEDPKEWLKEVNHTLTDPFMMNNYPIIRHYLLFIAALVEPIIDQIMKEKEE